MKCGVGEIYRENPSRSCRVCYSQERVGLSEDDTVEGSFIGVYGGVM